MRQENRVAARQGLPNSNRSRVLFVVALFCASCHGRKSQTDLSTFSSDDRTVVIDVQKFLDHPDLQGRACAAPELFAGVTHMVFRNGLVTEVEFFNVMNWLRVANHENSCGSPTREYVVADKPVVCVSGDEAEVFAWRINEDYHEEWTTSSDGIWSLPMARDYLALNCLNEVRDEEHLIDFPGGQGAWLSERFESTGYIVQKSSTEESYVIVGDVPKVPRSDIGIRLVRYIFE